MLRAGLFWFVMPSENNKPSLATQPEKPGHYTYLKEFRVEQCPLFLQHKCTQHRPYTCFRWHFMNQRRRRPIRKRDGTFNYNPDVYCTKFDETTGICPEADECPYLHRTAGDTERRYHLRYYKTGMCVHDTDPRGVCSKNGHHCAFAHGINDLRTPVYDVRELQAMDSADDGGNGPNSLDKERNLMNDDPKWQDTNYVLANYKTEACKRPPRLCRQGYACPQYHNSRDKRRTPKKHKYRSTPCPNVKQGDEWGDPGNCESGESCGYCHTRTEQQFHPEIYKSTKCNDMQQAGYCPRGAFCAFAHVDQEMCGQRDSISLDTGTNLADILNNVLPPSKDRERKPSDTDLDKCISVSNVSTSLTNSSMTGTIKKQFDNEHTRTRHHSEKTHQLRKCIQQQQNVLSNVATPFYSNDTIESVLGTSYNIIGNALDELGLDDGIKVDSLMDKIDKDCDQDSSTNPLYGRSDARGSAPMNIPGGGSLTNHNSFMGSNMSPPQSSPLFKAFEQFGSDCMGSNGSSKFGSFPGNTVLDLMNMSPGSRQSPLVGFRDQLEMNRLRDESGNMRRQVQFWESTIIHLRNECERWKVEAEQGKRRVQIVEQQRDEAISKVNELETEVENYSTARKSTQELEALPLPVLTSMQQKLQSDLDKLDKAVYNLSATKCMVCRERNRTVTFVPCNHYVLCSTCATVTAQCPYCSTVT